MTLIEQVARKANWGVTWRTCGNIRDWHEPFSATPLATQSPGGDILTNDGLVWLMKALLEARYSLDQVIHIFFWQQKENANIFKVATDLPTATMLAYMQMVE